jgi:RNA polymerase sigma factor (sigma-70 family)
MNTPSTSLGEALEKLRESPYDEAAWRVLYRELWPFVVAVASRTVGRYDDSIKDIAQEVFLRLLRAGPAADFASTDALRAYLRVVTVNEVRNFARRRLKSGRLGEEFPLSDFAQPFSTASAEQQVENNELLRTALETLTEVDKNIVVSVIEGYSISEISQMVGLSYSAVGVRLHRLRKRLAKLLQDKGLRSP